MTRHLDVAGAFRSALPFLAHWASALVKTPFTKPALSVGHDET